MKTKYLHPRSALTADDVVSIRIAVALGVPSGRIARATGIPKSTVYHIGVGLRHGRVVSEKLFCYEIE